MKKLSPTGSKFAYRFLQTLFFLLLISPAMRVSAQSRIVKDPDVIGRWDLTFTNDGKPSWLEVQRSGTHTLIGRFCYKFGSARPISEVKVSDGKYSFSIPPQWEQGNRNMDFEFEVSGDKIKGTMVYTDGTSSDFTGVRAPAMVPDKAPVWGKPIRLFNGKDLTGWHVDGKTNQWVVENGIMRSHKSGSNIMTDRKFKDFKLHVEFRYQEGSNSGVYLRGRYETQIIDVTSGDIEPYANTFSSIYGMLAPNKVVAKNPGLWQSYDITLVGRMVTVVANGQTVISKAIIAGPTGGAIDSNEGEPGPLYFQGDHGPIDFRNIVITPGE